MVTSHLTIQKKQKISQNTSVIRYAIVL